MAKCKVAPYFLLYKRESEHDKKVLLVYEFDMLKRDSCHDELSRLSIELFLLDKN